MTDLDLDISYEDGLRLSELVGQLESQQFELDHFATMQVPDSLIFAGFASILILLIGFMVLFMMYDVNMFDGKDGEKRRNRAVIRVLAITAILGVVAYLLSYSYSMTYGVLNLEQDIASTEGQINALLAKYNMTWEDIL